MYRINVDGINNYIETKIPYGLFPQAACVRLYRWEQANRYMGIGEIKFSTSTSAKLHLLVV
jgi:hypothetical protein